MGVIWLLSSIPSSGQGELAGIVIPEVVQNGAHAVVFGILAACWAYALSPALLRPRQVILYCFAYGIVDELHQIFVPGRTASLLDVAVDVAGAATVALLISWYIQRPGAPAEG
jgi:VanZ family protein